MRRLFIARKDLHMSAGKLAAQVGHCAEIYWLRFIQNNANKVAMNEYPANIGMYGDRQHKIMYRHPDLANLQSKALAEGKEVFYAGHGDPNDEFSKIVEQEPDYAVFAEYELPVDIFDNYINGSIVKTICEATNLKHLLKAKTMAEELGLIEGQDFGLVNDNCLTELEPENEDGTTTTAIWFKPLPDDIAHKISRKYQLYKDKLLIPQFLEIGDSDDISYMAGFNSAIEEIIRLNGLDNSKF